LELKIVELAKKDMREHYMTCQFTRLNAMDLEIKMNYDWGFGDNKILVSQACKLLGSDSIPEESKKAIYEHLGNIAREHKFSI